jgi:hypothetical protein
VHAVLGGQRARLDLELLQRVGERQRQIQVVVGIVVRRAVEQVGDAVGLAARDRERESALRAAETPAGRVQLGLRHDRRQVLDEIGRVPAVQGQLQDPLVVHHLADAHVARLDERRCGLDDHRLFDRAERQLDVDRRAVADAQHDAGAGIRLEAGEVDLEAVRSNRQVRQRVGAIRVGHGRPLEPGVGLRGADVGAWQHAAAGIFHETGDLRSGTGLRGRDRAGEKEYEHAAEQTAHDALHQNPPDNRTVVPHVTLTMCRSIRSRGGREYTRRAHGDQTF